MKWQGITDIAALRRALARFAADTVAKLVVSLTFPEGLSFLWQRLSDRQLEFTVGLHPHEASKWSSAQAADQMERAMKHPRHVAISEVGIDHSKHQDEEERQRQVEYLRRAAGVAVELQKLVVIHCLPSMNVALITQEISASVHHKVYIHCFLDDVEAMRQWKQAFQNVVFGLGKNVVNRERK